MKSLLISACLCGEKCRYDGRDNLLKNFEVITQNFLIIPVCPEVLGGLETPRSPSEISGGRVITRCGKDVTDEYMRGAHLALKAALESKAQYALMKAKSPSCGCGKIYDGTFSGTLTVGDGITVRLLKENGIRVFDETQVCELLEHTK